MKTMKKKGMAVGDLYQLVLMLVLVGLILGVGVLTLGKFATTSGITAEASGAINDTIDSLTPIASDWMPLIVTVSILSIILGLVLTAFAVKSSRR